VTDTDDALRDALRDLIPDYTGPVDPLPRVVATVRRRRVRQRTLLAVGGTGLAVVLALTVPTVVLAPTGGTPAAAPPRPDAPTPAPAPLSGPPASPVPAAPVLPVSTGTIDGVAWAIGSTSYGPGAGLCLVSDDRLSADEVVCFDGWAAGDPVTWTVQPWQDKGPRVTRVAGVAPAGTDSVRIRLAGRPAPLRLPVSRTGTDRDTRFFGSLLPGAVAVRDVTALDTAGRALGPPVTDPGYSCHPAPNVACAPPR
jgi:hypothetical protein